MQKGHKLQFQCQTCQHPIRFSIFELEGRTPQITCSNCGKKYAFEDEVLRRQLKKFEALCRQIHESEEILGNTCVGVDLGDHHVKVPYKLLLTRLNSSLELTIGGQPFSIAFRVEPIKDLKDLPISSQETKGHER